MVKNHRPSPVEPEQEKKTGFHSFWVWLIVAFIGIGVMYFGLSGIMEQLTAINDSIQANSQAIKEQTHILSDMKRAFQQLIVVVKDSVNEIIQSI
ncbi:hypothetical protein [Ammoniphilus sp. YIM 78166]|uniref:hypothetical protein n=1 Tax=Ammoniphilus sp. YIM 78166 TaxID=1644106 RepID=UPI00106FC8AE|nr:hypothetical protein [Ammoniphilus sp. YIM 78166]